MGEMHEPSDAQLLRDYAEHRDEAAFREIVRRHTDVIYSAALRQVASPDLARDVAQGVFTDLARKAQPLAESLAENASVLGWLFRSTRYAALNLMRDDRRRQARERHVMEHFNPASETTPEWDAVQPILDEAMADLSDEDRDALLLRFFKNQDFRVIGQSLGVSDDTAQKRVSRALERLRAEFIRRGVTTSSIALSTALSANAVAIAPAGLAGVFSTTAMLSGAAVQTSAAITITKTITMTTLQKTFIAAALTAAVGTGIYQAHQTSNLREQNESLEQQQTAQAGQLAKLQTENKRLSNQVAQVKDSQALSKEQSTELLKLRGQVALARADSVELSKLKSTLANRTGQTPDFFTNAVTTGLSTAENWKMKDAQARLDRMKKMLNLSDDQAQAISDIMQKHIQGQTQMTMAMLTGKITPEQQQAAGADRGNQEAEIKALFTPEQLAVYPEYLQAEATTAADNSAQNDANQIAGDFSLSDAQREQIHEAFYQIDLNTPQDAVSAARQSGNLATIADVNEELQKSQLEKKLKTLEDVLTPEQINVYRDQAMKQINMQAAAMKMFLPQKADGTSN